MARKPPKNKFYLEQVRSTATITVDCHANPLLFRPWHELTKAQKLEFRVNGPIPCEGGGVPGTWCENCRFGKLYNDPPE